MHDRSFDYVPRHATFAASRCDPFDQTRPNAILRLRAFSKSFSTKPRVVSAGVPIRRPLGTSADTSPGTVF